MAIGPNERRAKAEATARDARAQNEAQTTATRKKTARLKEQRLAKEAADKAAAPAVEPAKPRASRAKKAGA